MRLGNGRPPHPIPPHGMFHPNMGGMRSRELLAVTPNPPQLTVQGKIFSVHKWQLFPFMNFIVGLWSF